MTTGETKVRYEGRWRRLTNLAADRAGSIHDDEAARSLGFEGAFVPGSTVAQAAQPALVHYFGPAWIEGGWYAFKFVTPVYTKNEVREVADVNDDGTLDIRVETSEGRLCCSGAAGLGFRPPWDASRDGTRGAEDALPGVEIGLPFEEREFRLSPESVRALLDSAGDDTPWYVGPSPWGGAVVPPERLMNVALEATRTRRLEITGVRNPGMWAEHAIAMRAPVFLEAPYLIQEHVADKGRSGRTVYITYEFAVLEPGQPEPVAIGRHKVKWLAE